MNTSPSLLESVFFAAREIPSPGDRTAYLDRVCAGNVDVRRGVERMLAVEPQLGQFLDTPAHHLVATVIDPIPKADLGTMIGPYRLCEVLGEGGMGVVYLAEQETPIRRRLALKIIKPGMDTKEVIARFEVERQALALMDHPNIAKVYDAGTMESGRPYFGMELVHGLPITDYCDQVTAPLRDRMELFISVCRGVQHAHQKGIIHRDLKPSNILVTLHDGVPVPKVIDFGVARAIEQRLTDKTIQTRFSQVIGSPLYMSPEQAAVNAVDIDTRSDVYSLGVLLYELLTGHTPFDRDALSRVGLDEVRRMIREDDPPRPSQRVSTLAHDNRTTVASQRSLDERPLVHTLRGDLDWIVMKALEKDRTRRYDTVSALAADVGRYLFDEPVQACPPSEIYRIGKFISRNRATLTATACVALALLLGAAVSIWQGVQARVNEQRALTEAAKANEVVALLSKVLESADPDKTRGREYTVRQMLEDFSERFGDELHDQPEVEMTLRAIIGKSCRCLGMADAAAPHVTRSLQLRRHLFGDDHELFAEGLIDYAWLQSEQNDLRSAAATARQAVAILRRRGQPEQLVRALRILTLRLRMMGKRERLEAEALSLEAMALVPRTNPDVISIVHNLAVLKAEEGKYEEAEQLARDAVALHRAVDGPSHPETGWSLRALSNALRRQGRYPEALQVTRESLAIFRTQYQDNHGSVLFSLGDLCVLLSALGEIEEARTVSRELMQLSADHVGPLNGLAWDLCKDPDFIDPAIPVQLAERAVQLAPNQGDYWNTLGVARYRSNDWSGALDALQKSMDLRSGGDSWDWFFLAMTHWQLGDPEQARKWYNQAVTSMDEHRLWSDELNRFRAEAATSLGIPETPKQRTTEEAQPVVGTHARPLTAPLPEN